MASQIQKICKLAKQTNLCKSIKIHSKRQTTQFNIKNKIYQLNKYYIKIINIKLNFKN